MTQSNQLQQQSVELKIQQEIRRCEDELVIWIQEALDNKKSYGKLEEAQFRNLVRVADTTDSPEVVKNFLRYQVGRDQKWGRGKDSLAERIVGDIDGNIKKAAEAIAKTTTATDTKQIWMELIRRYLGYGARYLKYLRDGNKI
ncbi:hypothetical protein OOK60_12550 [Trichothermofontia sichuanensis B231]|uniref:hypothetical protein n=1 Tax=Trichothermofontia sichuanensis TaxID=3045816 RepID=UPI002247CABC|nr:hypothetical protein [Trichothermofontia sichuanensis]UZQ53331.1 hypothetical protein OOK60_12550 [Trichothermofontia sichuanensis B231]